MLGQQDCENGGVAAPQVQAANMKSFKCCHSPLLVRLRCEKQFDGTWWREVWKGRCGRDARIRVSCSTRICPRLLGCKERNRCLCLSLWLPAACASCRVASGRSASESAAALLDPTKSGKPGGSTRSRDFPACQTSNQTSTVVSASPLWHFAGIEMCKRSRSPHASTVPDRKIHVIGKDVLWSRLWSETHTLTRGLHIVPLFALPSLCPFRLLIWIFCATCPR